MRWCRIGLLVASLLAVVPPVLAQTKDESQRALTLGHEGLAAYNKGNWAEARGKFTEAEGLAHSPVFVLYLARSARNAGDLAAAKAAYDKVAAEVLPAGAPAPWAAAVTSAKQEREELEKRLAEIAAAASASASASTPAPTTTLAPSSTAPAPSVTSAATATATAAPSATTNAAPTSSVVVPPGGPATAGERGPLAPGLAVAGLGVVGVGIGIGLFVHAKSIADGVLVNCPGDQKCPASDRPTADTALAMADGATGAFAAGAALLGAGLVLLVVRPGGKPAPAKAGLAVQPGWASLRVSGSF